MIWCIFDNNHKRIASVPRTMCEFIILNYPDRIVYNGIRNNEHSYRFNENVEFGSKAYGYTIYAQAGYTIEAVGE